MASTHPPPIATLLGGAFREASMPIRCVIRSVVSLFGFSSADRGATATASRPISEIRLRRMRVFMVASCSLHMFVAAFAPEIGAALPPPYHGPPHATCVPGWGPARQVCHALGENRWRNLAAGPGPPWRPLLGRSPAALRPRPPAPPSLCTAV